MIHRSDGCVALRIEREIFSLDALLRAAYKFTDRCHVFLQSGGAWRVAAR